MAKYQLIRDLLRERIFNGSYPADTALPGFRELAAELAVSYVTVSNAIKELTAEGLVEPVRGHGVYVREPSRVVPTVNEGQIGLIMPTGGDLFGNFFSAMLAALEAYRGVRAVPLANQTIMDQWTELERRERFESFLASGFQALVIDGTRHMDFRILQEMRQLANNLTFVFRYDSALEIPDANFILPDYVKVGRLAAEYLLARGVERLVMLSFERQDEVKNRVMGVRSDAYDCRIFDGVEGVMREHGMDILESGLILYEEPEKIPELLKGKRCGFIGVGDSRIKMVYQEASRLGMRAGKDFNAVGLFNTSWCEVFEPYLTSISVNEERIGRLAVRSALENWRGRKITIEPQLIIRNS